MINSGYSELRNPFIAKIFYMAGYIEMWGKGAPEIISSCLQVGDPEPEFIINDDISFLVKLKFPREILNMLMSEKELSVKQLATRLSNPPTDRTIRSELMHLKKLGLVSYRGKATNITWFFINSEDR
jgi:ATP-dependent DNA helicase RecG